MTYQRIPVLALFASASLIAACGGTQDEPISSEGNELDTFATVCPGANKVYGIDVSEFQGSINWASVKAAGKQFALIRVSDGTGHLDPNFATNWTKAKAAGLVVGAYQFFRPTENATTQADLVVSHLSAVGYGAGDLPPVIDVEVTDGAAHATISSGVNTWIARIKSRTGRLPSLYTSPGYWSGIGNPAPTLLPYIWVANWGVSCPTLPPPWGRLRFWQYSDSGSVSGISGNVDLDEYNGTLAEMKAL